jgi:hypothetical protein
MRTALTLRHHLATLIQGCNSQSRVPIAAQQRQSSSTKVREYQRSGSGTGSGSISMATSIDEKHAETFESAIVTNNELPTPVQGINRAWSAGSYPRLSEFMGLWPEVAIFRRFGALNAQNLLFLQAELAHLERELKVIREREEKQEDAKGLLAQRSWFELSQATEDGEYCPQWTVIQDIRSKLSEYSMGVHNRPL